MDGTFLEPVTMQPKERQSEVEQVTTRQGKADGSETKPFHHVGKWWDCLYL